MNKIISTALAIGILLASAGVFYHYVVFLPGVQAGKDAIEARKAEAALEAKAEAERREGLRAKLYEVCMAGAAASYDRGWEKSCARRNLQADCALPGSIADSLGDFRKEREALCLAEAKAGLAE